MKYLTIHNALEDAAAFEDFARAKLPLTGKWIAVGGSYPGMLAAFYREKHPELVVGAWASSAPVDVSAVVLGLRRHRRSSAIGDDLRRPLPASRSVPPRTRTTTRPQRDAVSMKLLGYAPGTLADFLN